MSEGMNEPQESAHGQSYDERVGANIAEIREASGLSQTALALKLAKAGLRMSQQTITKIENGSRPLRLSEARAMAEALDCDVDVLDNSRDLFTWAVAIRTQLQNFDRAWDDLAGAAAAFEQAQTHVRRTMQRLDASDRAERALFLEAVTQRSAMTAWDIVATAIQQTEAGLDPQQQQTEIPKLPPTIEETTPNPYYRGLADE